MFTADLHVIVNQGPAILGILAFMLSSQFVLTWILKRIFDKHLNSMEYLFLGLSGWILPASLIAAVCLFLGFQSTGRFNLIFLFCLLVILLIAPRLKTGFEPDSRPIFLFLLLFFATSFVMRLAFISRTILPSYFDAAQHYLIIKNVLKDNLAVLFALQANYYHLGFHILAAFVVSTLQTKIALTILLLGQIILAIMPIAVFFPVRHITRSDWAAVFAVLTSAWGWYMPAHAVDWGKYPALTSISLLPFVLSLAYLFAKYKTALAPQKQLVLGGILAAGTFITAVAHSRSLVIFGISILTWVMVGWQQKLSIRQQGVFFSIVLVAILVEYIFIQQQPILYLLFDPYIHKGILITVLILFLSVFALWSYPQLTFACSIVICFLFGSLFIPIPNWIPGYTELTLLDRPFVEMILYLPLSLLGGLGLAGLEEFLRDRQIKPFFRNHYLSLMAIGLILIYALVTHDPYPSSCCVLADNDDVVAIDWIDNKLPMEAQIGIASTALKVTASEIFEGIVGSDAGIWITPLIDRATIPLPASSDFEQQAVLTLLCQKRVSHLYSGSLGQNFNTTQLNSRPAWYQILLSISKVKVYQVIGCNGN